MIDSKYIAVGAVFLVVLAGVAGATTVATQSTTPSVTIESSPTDPNDAEATHTVVFTPVESTGETFDDIRVNYSVDKPTADVSNVKDNTIERIGIDRDGDDNGTQIDVAANVTEVSGKTDGEDVRIQTNNNLSINSGDEIVVVLRPVQNPQNNGTANVTATVNTQNTQPESVTAESATDNVTYEYNSAFVNFTDQSRNDTVRVKDVSLSEDGHVVILNESGENPDEVRGATFVRAGRNKTVFVDIEPNVETQTELWAQIHLDTNGDELFNYSSSGGDIDEPFKNKNGDVMASDNATVGNGTSENSGDAGASSSGDGDPDITNYEVTSSGEEITVSFDSDENLVDIEVDVRGPDEGTLTEEDFDGDRFEGYEATYQADSDGEYTLELVTAEDSSSNDGADDGDYSDSTSVQTSDNGTATASPTPTDDGTPDDETPTDDGTPDDDTPTEDSMNDTPTEDSMDDTPTEDSMDDDTPTDGGSMDDETASPTDGDGAGFGGAIAVGALLASLLLFYRRH